jgi:hypothetical protein
MLVSQVGQARIVIAGYADTLAECEAVTHDAMVVRGLYPCLWIDRETGLPGEPQPPVQ